LKVAPGDELLLEVIVYKEGNKPDFVKVNMLAPIILNITKRLGLQKILQNLDTQLAIKAS